jgi:hypothetical protein
MEPPQILGKIRREVHLMDNMQTLPTLEPLLDVSSVLVPPVVVFVPIPPVNPVGN